MTMNLEQEYYIQITGPDPYGQSVHDCKYSSDKETIQSKVDNLNRVFKANRVDFKAYLRIL